MKIIKLKQIKDMFIKCECGCEFEFELNDIKKTGDIFHILHNVVCCPLCRKFHYFEFKKDIDERKF